MSLFRYIAAGVVLMALAAAPLSATPPADYQVAVGGSYAGTGSATLNGHTLQINATVSADAGHTRVPFTVTVTLDANSRYFTGNATLDGHAVTVTGRVDTPAGNDPQEKHAPATRITAQFNSTNPAEHQHGRIIGMATATLTQDGND